MTKEQFVQARALFLRRDRWRNAVYLVVFFSFLIAVYLLSSYVPEQHNNLFVAGFLAILGVNAAAALLWGRNQAARAGLVCVSCGGGLLNAPGDIAVATGNCPHCGKHAFSGSDA